MAYPFDETGIMPSNLVVEEKTITEVNGIEHNYFIPEAAPFHASSMVVVHKETGRILQKDVDYYLTHYYTTASDAIGSSIYAGVALIDPNITGSFALRYQTIGGDWVNSDTIAVRDGLSALNDLLTIRWEEVVPDDMTFPPTRHTQPVTDIEAITEIINEFKNIADAIRSGSRDITMADIKDLETAWIQPNLNALERIAQAIEQKENASYLTHGIISPRNNPTVLGDFSKGQWEDTPLVYTIPRAGSWKLDWDVNVEVDGVPTSDVRTRVVIDGSVIDSSYVNGQITSLNLGKIVTVQMKLMSDSGSVKIAAEEFTSSLSMLRVSN